MEVLLVFILVLLVAVAVVLLKRYFRRVDETYPYKRRKYFFSPAERSFYGVLLRALEGFDVKVFAKVRLLDVLYVPDIPKKIVYLNRVSAKHVDFLICDSKTLSPRLVIELDDSSHAWGARRRRDSFLDAALVNAGLPVLRFRVQRAYDLNEIRGLSLIHI